MKVYFDMEFTGLVPGTTPISLGMVSETGEKFYAEFSDYRKDLVDGWIEENVINHLVVHDPSEFMPKKDVIASLIRNEKRLGKYYSDYIFGTCSEVKDNLEKWLKQFGEQIQLVGDCCHYDMVLLCNLFGGALSLPEFVNPVAIDLCVLISEYDKISPYSERNIKYAFNLSRETYCQMVCGQVPFGQKHNSLYDAKVIKAIFERITSEVVRPAVRIQEEVTVKNDKKEISIIPF